MSVIVTIDVLAAVKEALQEPEIRDVIRAIALESADERRALPEGFVDSVSAAQFLGMSAPAVRMAAYRGTIPCSRMGRRLRFRLSDLAAWVAGPKRQRR